MIKVSLAALLLAASLTSADAKQTKGRQPTLLQTGIAQFQAEKLDEAKATLAPLGKAGDPEAMLYLGRIAIEQADGDAAVDWLEQAIKVNDRKSVYHQWLGVAYSVKVSGSNPFTAMSLASSVRKAMERAIELDSTNVDARVNLSQFYLEAPAAMGGGAEKARKQAAALTSLNPYRGRLLDASIAENQKDTVVAERTLRDLVAAFPDSSAPVTRLATHYLNMKRYDDAFRVLDARLRRSPNDEAALYQLGRVGAVSRSRLDEAQAALDRYMTSPHKRGNPSIAAAHWRLGLIHETRGDKPKAVAEYETALRLDPKLAGAKASLDKIK
jgi:tetratricopeptide (TPR) repeat protein